MIELGPRRPAGMPGWAFWVAATAATAAALLIPTVGPLLAIVVVLIAIWLWLRVPRRPLHGEYAPVPITGRARLDVKRLRVVDEARYADAIRRAVRLAGRRLDAELVWQPSLDRVRVDLVVGHERITCGRVPSGETASIAERVRAHADEGRASVLTAHIRGGTPDRPRVAITLGPAALRAPSRVRFAPSS